MCPCVATGEANLFMSLAVTHPYHRSSSLSSPIIITLSTYSWWKCSILRQWVRSSYSGTQHREPLPSRTYNFTDLWWWWAPSLSHLYLMHAPSPHCMQLLLSHGVQLLLLDNFEANNKGLTQWSLMATVGNSLKKPPMISYTFFVPSKS